MTLLEIGYPKRFPQKVKKFLSYHTSMCIKCYAQSTLCFGGLMACLLNETNSFDRRRPSAVDALHRPPRAAIDRIETTTTEAQSHPWAFLQHEGGVLSFVQAKA